MVARPNGLGPKKDCAGKGQQIIYKSQTCPLVREGAPQKKKHRNGLDIQQIYGYGSHRGPMPGVTVPAECRQ
jgi:hypothetical protein